MGHVTCVLCRVVKLPIQKQRPHELYSLCYPHAIQHVQLMLPGYTQQLKHTYYRTTCVVVGQDAVCGIYMCGIYMFGIYMCGI